ncbi:MAG: threonine synthase [Melioribacteraceae bacterium]|nr:threonine synthase [Melioribacteraceae bacterium]MCF8264902.1 threonine synthase [Melioribacteraceae bacterium]MCF8432167.1 threonine synthase [Melioribacteraceae bacterium]
MNYYSTNNVKAKFTFKEAVVHGLAPDGGLYMPELIPPLQKDFIKNLKNYLFEEIAFEIAKGFVDEEINNSDLSDIIKSSINFPAPIHKLSDSTFILELFHGPTLAFKDFGARFMARTMSHFVKDSKDELNILVATSGDTGSAVANGFYNAEGINVYILYPSGKVSESQEKQLTTMGGNITALEINGTFDDCQRIVKEAFVDSELTEKLNLSSANSINISRLLPQSFYYFEAFKQLPPKFEKAVFCVPSGNLGNLTAGLFAKKMGLPIEYFISATNSNSVFTEFINSGRYAPRESIKTFSNAMDVGTPSNLDRIKRLYQNDIEKMRCEIKSSSHSDPDTLSNIKRIYEKHNYILDPHGSVGYLAMEKFSNNSSLNTAKILLETAHHSKFLDVVEQAVNKKLELHPTLRESFSKEKISTQLSNKYSVFKEYLICS